MTTPQTTGWSVYRRLLGYSLKYWPYLLLAVVGLLLNFLLALLERRFTYWRRGLRHGG